MYITSIYKSICIVFCLPPFEPGDMLTGPAGEVGSAGRVMFTFVTRCHSNQLIGGLIRGREELVLKASSLRASSIGLRRYCSLSNFRQMLVLISYRQVQKQENLTFATSEFYEIFREHFVVHSLVSATHPVHLLTVKRAA